MAKLKKVTESVLESEQNGTFEIFVGQNGPIRTRALNFSDQTYIMHTLTEPTKLYRVFGGSSKACGHWWTRTKPESTSMIRNELAIKPEWSDADFFVIKIFPVGTLVYEGTAAPKGSLNGGGNQVFIEDSEGDPPSVEGLQSHRLTKN